MRRAGTSSRAVAGEVGQAARSPEEPRRRMKSEFDFRDHSSTSRGHPWRPTTSPISPTTTAHSHRTSPARSWSCTTPSTTRPTSRASTPRWRSWLRPATATSFGNINKLEKNLAFHLGGHINHSVFWPNMSPNGGDKPDGELGAAIDEFFGSFDKFRAHFEANANAIQGSGWSMLVYDTLGARLNIVQLFDQQGNLPLARSRSCCSTCGSTRSTCSTRTSRPTTPRPGGTSSTGPTRRPASPRPSAQTAGLIAPF